MLSEVITGDLCEQKVKVPNVFDFYYMVGFHETCESPIAYSSPVWMDND